MGVEGTDATSQGNDPLNTGDKEHNFAALREQVSNLKNEKDGLKQQLSQVTQQLQSFAYQQNQASQQPQEKVPSADDEDFLTKGEVKRLLAEKERQFNVALNETKVQARYGDYSKVVNQDVFAPLMQQEPELRDAIMSSSNPNLVAYYLGKGYAPKQTPQTPPPAEQNVQSRTQQMIDNSMKPGSINNATSGSGSLSGTDYWNSLSDEEFEAKVAAIKRGG